MIALILQIVFGICSVLALIYFGMLFFVVGIGINFSLFWPVLSAVCAGLSYICHMVSKGKWNIPVGIWGPVLVIALVILALFIYLEAIIISTAFRPPADNASYCIILGCRVNGRQPSAALWYRIEAAAEYLEANPDTIAIASGGQGADEDISEAQCIRDELVERGIDPGRIILEEDSTSTMENVRFSMGHIEDPSLPVVIITSEYHVYRGIEIAKKAGLTNVSGLRANPGPVMALNYYVREAFAVVKDFLVGNL